MEKDTTVDYKPETHEYLLNGEKAPSVTELAARFSKLNKEWLGQHPEYAARGTVIHAELSEYYEGIKSFDDLENDLSKEIAEHLDPDERMKSEVIVYNTTLGYAGTADLVAIKGTTVRAVVDIKTGRTRSKLYEQCQLSLYLLALQDMGYTVNEETHLYILHPDGLTQYQPLSWDKMKQLDEGDLDTDEDTIEQVRRLTARLDMLKVFVDEYDAATKELKELLGTQFQEKEANTFVCNDYKFTYIAASTRKSVDRSALKKAGLYDQYVKETQVAASVRITKVDKE